MLYKHNGKIEMLNKGYIKAYMNCFICGSRATEEHHCISGHNRDKCDKLGLTVPLCRQCHYDLHNKGHCTYKRDMQVVAEKYFLDSKMGTIDDWMSIFHENYI